MPLEPASAAFLAELAAAGMPPIEDWTPSIVRLGDPVLAGLTGPGPDVGAARDLRLASEDGTFRVRMLRPAGVARATIVYFHGGGWVGGDIDLQYDHVGRDLVNATRSTVVLVNYRKAPEHPFPAAIEDSWLALDWAAEHAAELAPPGAPLLVAGDSAGGNIAAVLAQRARDEAGPHIDGQVLIYPVTDCDFTRPSYADPDNQLFLDRETMIWYWNQYLPDEPARHQPAASPLRAETLAGLPPALVYVAEYDPLRDEGVAYAEALRAAGVPVVLEEAEGQMHGFFQMANILPGYDEGLRLVAGYVNDLLSADDKDRTRA